MTETLTLKARPTDPQIAGTQTTGTREPGARRIVLTLASDGAGGADRVALFATLRRLLDRNADACLFVISSPEVRATAAAEALLRRHPRVHVLAAGARAGFPHLFAQCHLLITERAEDAEMAAALNVPTLLLDDAEESGRPARTGSVQRIGRNSERLLAAGNAVLARETGTGAFGQGNAPRFLVAIRPSARRTAGTARANG